MPSGALPGTTIRVDCHEHDRGPLMMLLAKTHLIVLFLTLGLIGLGSSGARAQAPASIAGV